MYSLDVLTSTSQNMMLYAYKVHILNIVLFGPIYKLHVRDVSCDCIAVLYSYDA